MNSLNKIVFELGEGSKSRHSLNIKKICGLDTYCYFERHGPSRMSFSIETRGEFIPDDDYCGEYMYHHAYLPALASKEHALTFLEVAAFVAKELNYIKNCSIDKFTGKLTTVVGETPETLAAKEVVAFFKDYDAVKLTVMECCVCYELTQTSLHGCEHHVCVDCIQKIQRTDCEKCDGQDRHGQCDEMGCHDGKKCCCPMCRASIVYCFH